MLIIMLTLICLLIHCVYVSIHFILSFLIHFFFSLTFFCVYVCVCFFTIDKHTHCYCIVKSATTTECCLYRCCNAYGFFSFDLVVLHTHVPFLPSPFPHTRKHCVQQKIIIAIFQKHASHILVNCCEFTLKKRCVPPYIVSGHYFNRS